MNGLCVIRSLGADIPMGPGFTLPAGSPMGIGYIDAKGKSLRFKDNGVQGSGNVVANFPITAILRHLSRASLWRTVRRGNELCVRNARDLTPPKKSLQENVQG